MTSEDIIVALRNAVNKGEQLSAAMQVMVNSGYNPIEVNEAAKYVGQGVIPNLQPNQEELAMQQRRGTIPPNQQPPQPNQQSAIQQQAQQNIPGQPNQPLRPNLQQPGMQVQPPSQQQPMQQQTPVSTTQTFKQQVQQQIPTKKKSHTKEIVLVLILLFLIGVLASTIFFRDVILGFFSG